MAHNNQRASANNCMHRTRKIILAIVGVVLFLVIIAESELLPGTVGSDHDKNDLPEGLRSTLFNMSAQLNSYLPMMIDEETRLLSTNSGDGKFRYNYMLIKHTIDQINVEMLKKNMRDRILMQVCTNEEMALFRKYNIRVSYSYVDKMSVNITTITVTPSECIGT